MYLLSRWFIILVVLAVHARETWSKHIIATCICWQELSTGCNDTVNEELDAAFEPSADNSNDENDVDEETM